MAGTAALPDGVLAIYDVDAFLSADDERAADGGAAVMLEGARALVRDQLGLDFPSRRDPDLERALAARSVADAALGAADRPAWRAGDRVADRPGELLLPRRRVLRALTEPCCRG